MKRFKILLIKISFLGFALQGCGGGGSTKTKKNYPTAIGTAVSITAEEENNRLIPKLSQMLKVHINEINKVEAVSFSKTLNYCDISGQQDQEVFGTLDNVIRKTNYQSCENDNNIQNGDTIMTYNNTDEDGKFPQYLELEAQNDYNFKLL